MAIRLSASKAITDVLTTVSASSSALTHGATAIADLTAAGAAHAHHYRVTTERSLELTAEEFDDIATEQAKHRIARSLMALSEERKDPAFEEIYNRITLGKPSTLAVAAE